MPAKRNPQKSRREKKRRAKKKAAKKITDCIRQIKIPRPNPLGFFSMAIKYSYRYHRFPGPIVNRFFEIGSYQYKRPSHADFLNGYGVIGKLGLKILFFIFAKRPRSRARRLKSWLKSYL